MPSEDFGHVVSLLAVVLVLLWFVFAVVLSCFFLLLLLISLQLSNLTSLAF